MINKSTAEPVIRFLRNITFDGNLSSDEIWRLANWLNEQPEDIAKAWPASALIPVLNSVFQDGALTSDEMEELALTIATIQELWTEQVATSDDVEELDIELTPPRLLPATLPALDIRADCAGENCQVDLACHTCTCSEWMENRARFAPGDYRRACEHIITAYLQLATMGSAQIPPPLHAFLLDLQARQRPAPTDVEWRIVAFADKEVLYGENLDSDWIHLYAPSNGVYQRFGYNKRERRWSYGEAPRGLRNALRQSFK